MSSFVMPAGRLFTVDDLDHFPDDGNRYEIIEGCLHVSPSPMPRHQMAVADTFRLLDQAAPAAHRVLFAPLDIVLGPSTVVQPDVLVIPTDTPTDRRIDTAPLLVVEVLSPSTWSYDLNLKQAVYRDAGVGSYWAVDPLEPSVTVWSWPEGSEGVQRVAGAEALILDQPYPVTVRPAELVA